MRPQPLVETEQHERHPVGRQDLEVDDVRHPERVEAVDDAGQHRWACRRVIEKASACAPSADSANEAMSAAL